MRYRFKKNVPSSIDVEGENHGIYAVLDLLLDDTSLVHTSLDHPWFKPLLANLCRHNATTILRGEP